MNVEIKKLKRSIYLTMSVVATALLILVWLVTHSFASIQIEPKNAVILIDDVPINTLGSGTARKFIAPGIHTLKVEASGYAGLSREINFGRGIPKTIKINLKKTPKPLTISNNGKFLGKGNDFNDFYYLESGGSLFKARAKTDDNQNVKIIEQRAITNPRISDVNDIIWSPTKELALLKKSGQVSLFDFKKYDFVNQTEEPWGESIGNIAWSPDNSKIAYYYTPPSGEKSLVFSSLTNKEMNRVLNLAEQEVDNPLLRWSPDSEWLVIIPRNEDGEKNNILLFNAYTRELTPISDTGNHLDASFSPDGNKILYSTYSKDPKGSVNSLLSIMDRDGSNKRSLEVRAELRKTVWSKDSENIIVATYDTGVNRESIYRFNTNKKQMSGFILKELGDIFIRNLVLTDDNKVIIYEDNSGIHAVNVY